LSAAAALATWSGSLWRGSQAAAQKTTSTTPSSVTVVPPFPWFDAHTHVFAAPAPLDAMLRRLDMRLLTICVVDNDERGYEDASLQHERALEVHRTLKDRVAWCATFNPQDWETPEFAGRVISQLRASFTDGAVAVKVYKSIGMELKSKTGRYLLPDDPIFDPIYKMLVQEDKTLFGHLAEPADSWRPLDPASPNYGYYKNHPAWHMYRYPDRPSKEAILAARDRMLAAHPRLRVVGCHLGSMEDDVAEIARRFDRYPNFAVDTAARVHHLMLQPREKVREFLIKYQDRVLYGSDLGLMPWDDPASTVANWERKVAREWRYFATDDTFEESSRKVPGLDLPEPVLRKLYRDNAQRWVPGIPRPVERQGE
jgi:predicted TIM-barrel fold metal-dependent hydrolase